ncbi:MAG: radical SAM protein [Sediminibacterium sp.]|nr:radical SAM protein [Sediminibacterium sp.]
MPLKPGVLLFNPLATSVKPRIPNSVLQVAASINGQYCWTIVDGNIERNPWEKIVRLLETGDYRYFGCTVMPGPQLKQAIPFSKQIREMFPELIIIWGGYFASNQYKTCLESGFVDFIINGPGDYAFPQLLSAIETKAGYGKIKNLIYKQNGQIIKTPKAELSNMDELSPLPYDVLNSFYPLEKYLCKTYLGKKTIAYHSSFGCPFTCSFCAVVPIYNARWKGRSAEMIYKDVLYLKQKYGGDAIEFHDNNFFVSEKRSVEFARLISPEKMIWWGEARIDTMDKYKDESLQALSESGCRMIFFGAETGNDEVLKQMDKGGTQTGEQILQFAARLRKFNIIPEYSFVLGTPAETEEEVNRRIDEDIAFIKKIKAVNPDTEIIIYTYSPVPTEGSELYNSVVAAGFRFPERLEDWISPQWENFDLRKNPLTPWLKPYMIDKIRDFETVLNGRYPSCSDIQLSPLKRKLIKAISYWRYKSGIYTSPKEIRLFHKIWKYRQPEKEGF